MKQTIITSSIALLAVAAFGNANAADAKWSGPYVGFTVGATNYSIDAQDVTLEMSDTGNLQANKLRAVAGLAAGMNWQVGSFVYGVEADVNLDTSGEVRANSDWGAEYSARAQKKWNASVRARAGIAVASVLPYITGGIDFANVKRKILYDSLDCQGQYDNCGTKTQAALTLGGGVEAKISSNGSLKFEYLHTFLPKKELLFTDNTGPVIFNDSYDTFRIGYNHHF